MKKYFRFLACAALLLGFAACSDDDDDKTVDPNPNPNPTEQLSKPVLTVASKDATSFVVSWTAVTNATSYAYTIGDDAQKTTSATQIAPTGLTPETAYTVKVKAVANGYTDSEWATVSVTTDKEEPVVTGALVEGVYQYTIGTDSDGKPVDNQMLVTKVQGNDYTVYALFGLPEYCYATYDKDAATLTLSGISHDSKGEDMQLFGDFTYMFDDEGTMMCGIFSYANLEDENAYGNDPWVLKVNEEGKIYQTTGYLYFGVAEYDAQNDEIGEILGNAGFLEDGDPIVYVGAAPAQALSKVQSRQKAPAMRFSSAVRMAQIVR